MKNKIWENHKIIIFKNSGKIERIYGKRMPDENKRNTAKEKKKENKKYPYKSRVKKEAKEK